MPLSLSRSFKLEEKPFFTWGASAVDEQSTAFPDLVLISSLFISSLPLMPRHSLAGDESSINQSVNFSYYIISFISSGRQPDMQTSGVFVDGIVLSVCSSPSQILASS